MSTQTELNLSDLITEAEYSPYGANKVANKVFKALGWEKELPPQMFYIYNSKGMLGVKGSKKVTAQELEAWLIKYLTKNFK
jgi:hypothetical protein